MPNNQHFCIHFIRKICTVDISTQAYGQDQNGNGRDKETRKFGRSISNLLLRNCNKKQENSFTFAVISTFVGLWAIAHIGLSC